MAVSGGKDSFGLLWLLRRLAERLPFDVSLVAVHLEQGHPGFPIDVLRDWLASEGFEHRIVSVDTYSIVKSKVPEGHTMCSLCSRLRRGILYNAALEMGLNKIALGHHKDDAIETLMLNLLYAGRIKAMPARLRSDDGRNVVIRPLLGVDESDLARYAELRGFPVIPCDLCGSQEDLQRKAVKRMIAEWTKANRHVRGNLFAALGHLVPSHLLDPQFAGDASGRDASVP